MKVSAFSICRNAVKFDYPIVEMIRSGLPVVDEFVVSVGQSDDGTLKLIRSIGSKKIRIVESFWDDNLKKDDLLFGTPLIIEARCANVHAGRGGVV